MYYQALSGIGIALLLLVAAAVAAVAVELRYLERSWSKYMDFIEPPTTSEEVLRSALAMPKSTEERARALDGRVPGTPEAALEETDQRRAWNAGEEEDMP